jgi:hypothetical protein
MKKSINVIHICALVLLLSSFASGQNRSTKGAASKQAIAAPGITCKGQPVAKGLVIVGYKSSAKCGQNSELIIKKPTDTEIVCDTSPVPEGYHVISQQGSAGCVTTDSNPLTNALSIARDGYDVSSQSGPSSLAHKDDAIVVNPRIEREKTKTIIQQRADQENADARRYVAVNEAIREHRIIVGMTKNEVLKSWGPPNDDIAEASNGSNTKADWYYRRGKQLVKVRFEDDILSSFVWLH